MAVTIKLRAGIATTWTANNPTLAFGEPGWESDTGKMKVGTGSTAWNSLAYFTPAPAAHTHAATDITSGVFADARISESSVVQHQGAMDFAAGQITSGTLAAARIGADTVDNTKLGNMAQSTIKGRAAAAGTGDPTDLTSAQVKTLLAYLASEVAYSNSTSGLVAATVQAALDEIDANVDAMAVAAPTITVVDYASASTASFPSGSKVGSRYIVTNANASGTTLGSTNQIVVHTNDALIARIANASTTNGADWHKVDNTDAVQSVAGRTGAVTLAAADILSGTFDNARIASGNVTQHQAALAIAWSQLTGVPATFAPAAHTLDSHSNVTISAIAAGELLKWSGSAWINNTLAEAGIAAASHVHSATDLTSGTLNNARVAASNVTQHQAALSIAGSQLTGTVEGGTP